MSKQKKQQSQSKAQNSTIVVNKKARHEYFIDERYEAGIALDGWEVKSLRAGKCQIIDTYVLVKEDEMWLLGSIIVPLPTVSTHIVPDQQRTRKLLMHRKEIEKLRGQIDQKGYTLVPLSFYWKRGRVKVELGLCRGKKLHDKRASIKERDWKRQQQRIMKANR